MTWFSEDAGFYGPGYLEEYEEILPQSRTIAEIDFIIRILGLKSDSRILDVPSGYGRHIIELAFRGYKVAGAELNRFFLSKCEEDATAAGLCLELFQRDMRELDFENEFDVVLNLFTSIGFFESEEEDEYFMAGVYNALRLGGVFIIDSVNRSWLTKNMKQKDWRLLPSGAVLLIERSFDEVTSRKIEFRTKIQGGVIGETIITSQRIYTARELVSMGESAGFSFLSAYGDFNGSKLSSNSPRAILCFEKKHVASVIAK